MKETQITKKNSFDKVIWLFILIATCIAVWANAHFAEVPAALRLAAWLLLACALAGLALITRVGKNFWRFTKETRSELRKVTWPTRQETVQTTLVVGALVILIALILWGVDTLILWLVGHLTG